MKRSKGITFLAFFYLIFGITSTINVLVIDLRIASYEAANYTLPTFYLPVMKVVSLIFGIAGIAIFIGLFRLREWGRKLVFIREGINILYSIGIFFIFTYNYQIPYLLESGRPTISVFIKPILTLLLVVLIIGYLSRPAIRTQFKRA